VLLIPNRIIAEDQAGKYVLAVNKDDVVEQKRITTGQLLVGGIRVVEKGLTTDDRVVLSTTGKAIPGAKVVPKQTTIEIPAADKAGTAPAPTAPSAPAAPKK
jgi:membrane fusion protein, multidrug efflux system